MKMKVRIFSICFCIALLVGIVLVVNANEGTYVSALGKQMQGNDELNIEQQYQDMMDARFSEEEIQAFMDESIILNVDRMLLTAGEDGTQRYLHLFAEEALNPTFILSEVKQSGQEFTASEIGRFGPDEQYFEAMGLYRYSVLLEDLRADTIYQYRVISDGKVSISHYFQFSDSRFIFIGDAQLNYLTLQRDVSDLAQTIQAAGSVSQSYAFVLSSGNQVQTSDSQEAYDAFISMPVLKFVALASNIGSQDEDSPLYPIYFPMPNQTATGDYYIRQKDMLIISINSNDENYGTHRAFIRQAIEDYPSEWIIVTMHHSPYSGAQATGTSEPSALQREYASFFSEVDVDLVLSGHDLLYSRTHFMKDGQISGDTARSLNMEMAKEEGETIYLTANSSSGNAYDDISSDNNDVFAVIMQDRQRSFTVVEADGDSLNVFTCRATDSSIMDSFAIQKQ